MNDYLLISDAAKAVQVESHVLRYWEEELQLPIKRNELGHRYYSTEDIDRFKNIKSMKERGLQLKAIKMILEKSVCGNREAQTAEEHLEKEDAGFSVSIVQNFDSPEKLPEDQQDKSKKLQWILQQLISQAIQENNQELIQEIRDSVLKELDYQFRMQEEREEARAKKEEQRTESYYQRMDELLRKKSRAKKRLFFLKQ